ncbi:upstream stimulatory factor 1 isoform X1 [Coccinella septempunctata]|uniref:upstream stimulatory factor 1 isoform X1 n=1 Tax=Coccinella septempunctata TaxID=41139 RepID=UPI001D067B97|nr:upstream stimulatory factor 1 isoform X1 [Coccinella septempunctata]
MDMLDPLDSSETEIVESKVLITEEIIDKHQHGIDSDDEQNIVNHLSPQTLLETPGDEVHYSLRSPDGIVTYRVLQVDDSGDSGPQIVAAGTGYPMGNPQPVLTSNLNGQLYVIGNNDVFTTQTGTRAIAPRSSIVETNNSGLLHIKKRDERRRATHNEVERRRRDKINNWIAKLAKIIPEGSSSDIKGNGHYDGQSKGGILAKACDYIIELKDVQLHLDSCLKENKAHQQSIEILKQKNFSLECENRTLREMLKRNGIEIPDNEIS